MCLLAKLYIYIYFLNGENGEKGCLRLTTNGGGLGDSDSVDVVGEKEDDGWPFLLL